MMKLCFLNMSILFLSLFIERERERERERRGEAERRRQRIPNRLCAVSAEPDAGLDLTNLEIRT